MYGFNQIYPDSSLNATLKQLQNDEDLPSAVPQHNKDICRELMTSPYVKGPKLLHYLLQVGVSFSAQADRNWIYTTGLTNCTDQ